MKALKYTLFLSIAMFIACTKPPDYSDTPEIAFISLSETTMTQGSQNEEFITLTISFTDGDGDIGIDGGEPSVYFKDLRDGSEFITFVAPVVPEQGVGNGISGEMYIKVNTTCCIHPNQNDGCNSDFSDYPIDSLIYEVYIIDRSGNKSNVIETAPITLLCEN
ncbi:hypothetical protein N9H15_01250 [bacterium]|jgi:hypothetical protein|nr:hypothetical protein [bacterium]MDG1432939.1 hypothetical protein [Saprospiraceae bacterium]